MFLYFVVNRKSFFEEFFLDFFLIFCFSFFFHLIFFFASHLFGTDEFCPANEMRRSRRLPSTQRDRPYERERGREREREKEGRTRKTGWDKFMPFFKENF